MQVYRFILALLAIVLLTAAAMEQTTTISRHGVSLELPARWEGRVYENVNGLRVARAGTFPRAEEGDVVGNESVRRMGSEGIDIAIWWIDRPPPVNAGVVAAKLPLQIERSDFGSFACGFDVAPATAMRTVAVEDQLVQVVVAFGTASPGDQLVAEANRVLSTFSLS